MARRDQEEIGAGEREGREADAEEGGRFSRDEGELYVRLSSQSEGNGHGDGGSREGKEEEDGVHVSETERLIACVLAAMKDCTLSSEESRSSLASVLAGQPSQAKASAQRSSQANTAEWTSSQASKQAAARTSSQAKVAAQTSSQANAAARCITSLKHAHGKENSAPSNLNLDMQDERAHPKFRNLADLYKLSEV